MCRETQPLVIDHHDTVSQEEREMNEVSPFRSINIMKNTVIYYQQDVESFLFLRVRRFVLVPRGKNVTVTNYRSPISETHLNVNRRSGYDCWWCKKKRMCFNRTDGVLLSLLSFSVCSSDWTWTLIWKNKNYSSGASMKNSSGKNIDEQLDKKSCSFGFSRWIRVYF